MDVLVDYYNIPQQERRKGIAYLINRIISAIVPLVTVRERRVDMRLYGGWYEDTSPTRERATSGEGASWPYTDSNRRRWGAADGECRTRLQHAVRSRAPHSVHVTIEDRTALARIHRSQLIVRRREQKLVDTMLAADVFFNVHSNAHQIALVSSDDDLWPAINTALQFGVEVIHLHTVSGHTTRPSYLRVGRADYTELSLMYGVK